MESPNRQAVKLLREQRRRRKRVAVFLGMASFVVIGTVMALRMSGRAMNNQVLDCVLSHDLPHQHTEACYYTPPQEGAQKLLVCGMADFVVHKHDSESCVDNMGNLICILPEIEEHIHTEECYQEQRVLTCTLQEGEGGHIHSDSCQGPDYSAEPVCGIEETLGHTHDVGCYDEEEQLICGLELGNGHTHDDSCYPTVLTCGFEEGTGGHIHSEACYTMESTVICGKREVQLHTHNEDCYLHTVDQLDQAQIQELTEKGVDVDTVAFSSFGEAPAEENRVCDQWGAPVLKCGQLQVLEHIHGDGCYAAVDTEGKLVSQLGSGNEEADMPGQRTAVYQGASLRVTAIYDGEDFPENTRVNIERVDEEESLPEKQEQLSKAVPGDELQLNALLKVTVSGADGEPELSEPIRLLVEPSEQGTVMAAAWYNSSESLDEQNIFVQSEDAKFELLEMAEQESGGFATEVYPGALVGITQQPAEEPGSNESTTDSMDTTGDQNVGSVVLNISQSFEYEDDDYRMIFNVKGIARPKAGADQPGHDEIQPAEPNVVDIEPVEPADGDASVDDGVLSKPEATYEEDAVSDDGIYFIEPSAEDSQQEKSVVGPVATEEPTATKEPVDVMDPSLTESSEAAPTAEPVIWNTEPEADNITIAGGTLPANVLEDQDNPLGLMVERRDEDSQEYGLYADYAEGVDDDNGLPGLKVLSYTMYYKGVELDISECTVTLEITAKEKLMAAAAELSEKQESMAAEGTELPSVAMLTIVPVETTSEEKVETGYEDDYSMPATGAMLSQIDLETKLLDIANENVSGDSLVIANGAAVLGDGTEPQTVKTVLRTAGKSRSIDDGVNKDHFGVTANTKDNPNFTVQYYAWLDVVNKQGTDLAVINTSGGDLPKNGGGKDNSPNGNQLMGLNLKDNKIETNSEWREIFTEVSSLYIQRPNLRYFKPVGTETFYNLKQIWVLKEGGNANIKDADISANWDVYGLSNLGNAEVPVDNVVSDFDLCHFTNKPNSGDSVSEADKYKPFQKDGNWYFPIKKDTVIRLVFEPSSGENPVKANFYDYDITNGAAKGKNGGTVNTTNYGINKYNGSEEYNASSSTDARYAFGNGNAGTNYGDVVWESYTLNKANGNSYGNCTFQIATGIAANGNVIFNAGIDGPNLFGSGSQSGRTVYGNSGLNFKRQGDTYTLISASVYDNEDNSLSSKSDLTSFSARFYHGYTPRPDHTQKCSDPRCRVVASNNFWPLDKIMNDDLHFGADTANQKFDNTDGNGKTGQLPPSDDAQDHNSYFGMNFSVIFDLTTEYKGPLEYLFFGDDDMWVFLTQVDKDGNPIAGAETKLICDIGGVHSSVGEYVNLWDYVGKDKGTIFENNPDYLTTEDDESEHGIAHYKLDFFYTERGASGSTCWMQYTLPSVRSATSTQTEDELRRLEIKKEVTKTPVSGEFGTEDKTEQYDDSTDEFLFKLTLKNKDGTKLTDNYSYFKYSDSQEGGEEDDEDTDNFEAILLDPDVVSDGAYFTLKHGQYIVIDHLPAETQFTITECGVYDGYDIGTDGKLHFKFKEGEYDYEVGATIKQGDGGNKPMGSTSEENGKKVFSGEIKDNVSASVVFNNNFKTYQLPKTGGRGIWGLTSAGALMILAVGCLLARKHGKKD